MVACICHSPLHHQKPDFEGQSVIKASSYLLPFVLEAHRESLPRSCETSARRLSAESAEVYSTADLPASAAHIPFSLDGVKNLPGSHKVIVHAVLLQLGQICTESALRHGGNSGLDQGTSISLLSVATCSPLYAAKARL